MVGHVTDAPPRPRAVLFDLLMAVMDSPATWGTAAGNPELGMRWRDAVTARMQRAGRYVSYEGMVFAAAARLALASTATERLWEAWREMRPRPDAGALGALAVPYAFVTNCSRELARIATECAGLEPRFTLSAEEAGMYKPSLGIYDLASQRMGVSPQGTLYVAGAAYDATGALAAGMQPILVRRRPPPRSLDPRITVVTSLDEVIPFAH